MIILPLELVVHVLECLSYRDILKCKQVCGICGCQQSANARLNHIYRQISKRFQSIIKDSMSLGYRIQLGLSGLEDPDIHCTGPLSLSRRVPMLQEYLKNWDTLRFNPLSSVELEAGGVRNLHNNILSEETMDFVQLIQLPSPVRRATPATWKLPYSSLGTNDIHDYVTDPTQDLLVLYEDVLSPT